MMKPLLRIVCVLPACVLFMRAEAAIAPTVEEQLECPAEIVQESLPPAKAPAGWTASTRGALRLHAIDLSLGPPSEMAFLKPQVVTRRDKSSLYEWRELQAGAAVGKVWMACSYGRSDHVVLGKQLENNFSKCYSVDGKDAQGRDVIGLRCQL